jgi:hypothetical protein
VFFHYRRDFMFSSIWLLNSQKHSRKHLISCHYHFRCRLHNFRELFKAFKTEILIFSSLYIFDWKNFLDAFNKISVKRVNIQIFGIIIPLVWLTFSIFLLRLFAHWNEKYKKLRNKEIMTVYHDEVEIEDFEYSEEEDLYTYPCVS